MGLGDLNLKLGLSLTKFEDGLTKADKRLRRFGDNMTKLGTQLSTSFSAAIGAIGVKSVQEFANLDRLKLGLEAVTKSAVPASVQVDRLKKLAGAPGLGFEQAVVASTRLQTVGFSAKFAEETIKQVGNAVATTGGTAQNFDSVLNQFSQMSAKGKLLQEDIGVIQENMPAVAGAIKNAFGTANIEAIRETGVTAQEFIEKVVGELGNLKRVEGGLSNSFENLGQSVSSFFASVGEEINQAFDLQGKINFLSDALGNVSSWFSSLDDNTQRNIVRFAGFLAAVGPVLFIMGKISAVAQVLTLGLKNMGFIVRGVASAMSFLLSPVGLVIAAVAALAVGGIYLYKNWDSAKAVFINIWIKIENTVKKLINNVLKAIDQFTNAATFGLGGTSFAEKFSFKTEDYVDVPKWKSFGETMKEVGGDLLEYAGLAGKAKKATTELSSSAFDADKAPNISGGSTISDPLSESEQKVADLKKEVLDFQKTLKNGGALPELQNRVSDISSSGGQAAVGSGGFNIVLASKYSDAIQLATDNSSNFKKSLEELAGAALPAVDIALDSTQERANRFREGLAGFNQQLNDIVKGGLTDLATGFGEFLGDVATGAATGKSLIGVVLVPIANALESLGKLAISTGFAISGIKAALQSLNPGVAIAGGIALIALSKLVKSKAASLAGGAPKLAKGGLAYGETLAVVGDNPNARVKPEVIAPLDELEKYFPQNDGGGGGISQDITYRISGEDLLFIFNKANKRTKGRTI